MTRYDLVQQLMESDSPDDIVRVKITYPDGRTASELATEVYYENIREVVIEAEVKV
jgi:hypothetical protein